MTVINSTGCGGLSVGGSGSGGSTITIKNCNTNTNEQVAQKSDSGCTTNTTNNTSNGNGNGNSCGCCCCCDNNSGGGPANGQPGGSTGPGTPGTIPVPRNAQPSITKPPKGKGDKDVTLPAPICVIDIPYGSPDITEINVDLKTLVTAALPASVFDPATEKLTKIKLDLKGVGFVSPVGLPTIAVLHTDNAVTLRTVGSTGGGNSWTPGDQNIQVDVSGVSVDLGLAKVSATFIEYVVNQSDLEYSVKGDDTVKLDAQLYGYDHTLFPHTGEMDNTHPAWLKVCCTGFTKGDGACETELPYKWEYTDEPNASSGTPVKCIVDGYWTASPAGSYLGAGHKPGSIMIGGTVTGTPGTAFTITLHMNGTGGSGWTLNAAGKSTTTVAADPGAIEPGYDGVLTLSDCTVGIQGSSTWDFSGTGTYSVWKVEATAQ